MFFFSGSFCSGQFGFMAVQISGVKLVFELSRRIIGQTISLCDYIILKHI